MQIETSNKAFLAYGSVYKNMDEHLRSQLICETYRLSTQRYLTQFLHFCCDTYIEIQKGLGTILVSFDPGTKSVEKFSLNYRVHIKPNVYFSIVATTEELELKLFSNKECSLDVVTLPTPYEVRPSIPKIQIREILGCFYRVRTPGYVFSGESHSFFELTYVDAGVMYSEVDGISYELKEKQIILYSPEQFHKQYTEGNQSVSYMTILFDMETTSPGMPENWYSILTNRVFPYEPKIYSLMKSIVQEQSAANPYMDSLLQCLVTELIIRLLQGEFTSSAKPAELVRQNYQNDLFEEIISYVEEKLYEPLTVADICQQFSLSRSSMQMLFKNKVNQSPKKYISEMKLEKSCQLLRENRYTVSEIALKLGYSSIHYFSNAFSQKYHISPSEYARRIY